MRRVSLAVVLFCGLAVASTWPLATHIRDHLPVGTNKSATVPLASAWALWWTSDRAGHGFADYWDAPIFYPVQDSFAFSEPLILEGIIATPLLWAGASAALAHNLVLLLLLVANGLAALALLGTLGMQWRGRVLGGAMVVLLPYIHAQVGVLTLMPLAPLLMTVRAVVRYACEARGPSVGRGLAAGAWLGVTYLSCAQYGMFVVLAIAPALPLLLPRGWLGRRNLVPALPGLALAAALIAPVALEQRAATHGQSFQRSHARAARGSAGKSLIRAAGTRVVPQPAMRPHHKSALFPGIVKLVLGLCGLVWAWRRNEGAWRFLIGTGFAALALSLVARLQIGWASPYRLLRLVPGIEQIRSLWRFAAISQLVLVLLCTYAVCALWTGWAARGRRRRRVAVAALAVLALVELSFVNQPLTRVPARSEYAAVLQWIDAHLTAGEPIARLPFWQGSGEEAHEPSARWMYVGMWHGHPLVDGYSSYWPKATDVAHAQTIGFPDARSHDALQRLGVRFAFVHIHWLDTGGRRAKLAERADQWRRVAVMPEVDLEVYEVVAAPVSAIGSEQTRHPNRTGDATPQR